MHAYNPHPNEAAHAIFAEAIVEALDAWTSTP